MKLFLLLAILSCCGCHTRYVYVVRHAERADAVPRQAVPDQPITNTRPPDPMSSAVSADPDLSVRGNARAVELARLLDGKRIGRILVTATTRSRQTAAPLAAKIQVPMSIYGGVTDSVFLSQFRGPFPNTLVVGHSNTVDDLVNGISSTRTVDGDLMDTEFDRLYILRKRGSHWRVRLERYSTP